MAGKSWVLLSVFQLGLLCWEEFHFMVFAAHLYVYYWHKVHPLFKHAECLPLGIKIQPVSLNNGWNTKAVASASHYPCPLSRQRSGKAPCRSDLFCHILIHVSQLHWWQSCVFPLFRVEGIRMGKPCFLSCSLPCWDFWPLKLVCLGELLHVMLLSRLCDYYKCLWVTNVWWSSESFSPWEWTMCSVHSQAPIRGADICVWG